MLYDVFISHASEDKSAIARPLAEALRAERVEVWYDEFSLNVGDSLRRSIDRGLAQSQFGIVILSPSFFAKNWSNWELDGLVARSNSGEDGLLLPIWHEVSRNEVIRYSPPLADKIALDSVLGVSELVSRLLRVIRPQGSTLAIARDHLIDWGLNPPVISDDWWLDLAAFAESNDVEDTFQSAMGWGRWGFPLPEFTDEPRGRGLRLATAALQRAWQEEADRIPITQLTHPDEVMQFINGQPGLFDACMANAHYVATYAPQLTIPGFSGPFEPTFQAYYKASVDEGTAARARHDRHGSALTIDGRAPGCSEDLALRDPEFGQYSPSNVACGFVQGNDPMSGPQVRFYSHIDYAAWLLSDASGWLPKATRAYLTIGIAGWGVWPWYEENRFDAEFGFKDSGDTGSLGRALMDAPDFETLVLDDACRRDTVQRLQFSCELLSLPEDGEVLATKLLGEPFLGEYFRHRAERKEKRRGSMQYKPEEGDH